MTGAPPAASRSACSASPYQVCPLWKIGVSGLLRYLGVRSPGCRARPVNPTGLPSAVRMGNVIRSRKPK